MVVGIRANIPDSLKSKALIVSVDQNRHILSVLKGIWVDSMLTAKTRRFGTFTVTVDTIPPFIEVKSMPSDKDSKGRFRVRITDDLSGIKSYRATVDGKWQLLDYDAKNDMLSGYLEIPSSNTSHHFEIEVIDERDNLSQLGKDFTW
jgi:hypothetical protein